uniref:Non-homologous end-joining factor 1 n=1 Tax=Cyprinodon variegatus TaxID=28743 RepID=A0A3Q2FJ35_CYPVA
VEADALLQHPWLPVTIDGVQLLSKPWFGETAYRILLTDMQSVWEEKIEAAAVEKRSQELNRRLRASAAAFFSHLCEVAQPCLSGGQQTGGEVQMSVNRQQDGDLTLRLKSELAGLPFYWEFRCSPAPVALVCAHLVRPLLAMSRLLQSHVEQLEDLLFRKDEEIQDYQENGATLSRGTEHDDRSYSKENFRVMIPPGSSSELQSLSCLSVFEKLRCFLQQIGRISKQRRAQLMRLEGICSILSRFNSIQLSLFI